MPVKRKEFPNADKYRDLIDFYNEKYVPQVNKFLRTEPETRIIFLDGDFGYGKSSFLKKICGINDKYIYSPWLKRTGNVLEDIYYCVTDINKSKYTKWITYILFISVVMTTIFSPLRNIIVQDLKTCELIGIIMKIDILNDIMNIVYYLFMIMWSIIGTIAIWAAVKTLFNSIPLIYLYRRDYKDNYEKRIIQSIVNHLDNDVLVVEDIDRCDNIEEILIVLNNISEYIIQNQNNPGYSDKYILVTGDYNRTIRRIQNKEFFDRRDYMPNESERGLYIYERIVSAKINFPTLVSRLQNRLSECGILDSLTQIEFDEIAFFMKTYNLGIRFINDFIRENESNFTTKSCGEIYYSFIEYYYRSRYSAEQMQSIEMSAYSINNIYWCLNDYEVLFQRKENKKEKTYYKGQSCIQKVFEKIFIFAGSDRLQKVFCDYLANGKYPKLKYDEVSRDGTVTPGGSLKGKLEISDIENFLIGKQPRQFANNYVLSIKRCYFVNDNANGKYSFRNIANEMVIDESELEAFIAAYFAVFIRENWAEIEKNYPGLCSKINLLKEQKKTS